MSSLRLLVRLRKISSFIDGYIKTAFAVFILWRRFNHFSAELSVKTTVIIIENISQGFFRLTSRMAILVEWLNGAGSVI